MPRSVRAKTGAFIKENHQNRPNRHGEPPSSTNFSPQNMIVIRGRSISPRDTKTLSTLLTLSMLSQPPIVSILVASSSIPPAGYLK